MKKLQTACPAGSRTQGRLREMSLRIRSDDRTTIVKKLGTYSIALGQVMGKIRNNPL